MRSYYDKVSDLINYQRLTGKARSSYFKTRFYEVLVNAVYENKLYIEATDEKGQVYFSTKGNKNTVTIMQRDNENRSVSGNPNFISLKIPDILLTFNVKKKNIVDKLIKPVKVQVLCEDFEGLGDIGLIYKTQSLQGKINNVIAGINANNAYPVYILVKGMNETHLSSENPLMERQLIY